MLHILLSFIRRSTSPTQGEGKLNTTILNTVGVKIRDRNFSNNTVPDIDENFGGSTGLAKKISRIGGFVYLYLPISKE